jgi:hypothetical protein
MKNIRLYILFLFCTTLCGCKTNKDYLKLIYIPQGVPTDVEYEPCLCKMSIWDEFNGPYLDTISTYDTKKIDVFLNAFKKENIESISTFADFSNAFIYQRKKVIDTIYSNSHFTIFANKKSVIEKNIFLTLEGYKAKIKTREFIPNEFINLYQKKTKYIIRDSI